MNTEIRKKIEWAFYHYEKLREQDLENQDNIIFESIASDETKSYGGVGKKGSAVENKALRLLDLFLNGSWLKVVENTFTTLRFGYEFKLMQELYIKKKNARQIILDNNLCESSYHFWKNRWLAVAFKWAQEFKLIES